MKKLAFLILLLTIFSSFAQVSKKYPIVQRHYKNLSDSVYKVGDYLDCPEILFELGSAILLPQSGDSLKVIAEFLQKHPMMKVEISNHTDSRGDAAKNMILSAKRAQSVVDFLIKTFKIPGQNITAKGYNSTQPVYEDQKLVKSSDSMHYNPMTPKNRRTDIMILSLL